MTTPERTADGRRRVAWLVLGALVALVAIAWIVVVRPRPPQMGADEDVFNSVDALYTAVRNRDEPRLGACADRLHAYREAGKLPKESADYLDRVIDQARQGHWESAVERLYEFMLAQRRDGATDSASRPNRRSHPPKN